MKIKTIVYVQVIVAVMIGILSGLYLAEKFCQNLSGIIELAVFAVIGTVSAVISYIFFGPKEFFSQVKKELAEFKEDREIWLEQRRLDKKNKEKGISKQPEAYRNFKLESWVTFVGNISMVCWLIFVVYLFALFSISDSLSGEFVENYKMYFIQTFEWFLVISFSILVFCLIGFLFYTKSLDFYEKFRWSCPPYRCHDENLWNSKYRLDSVIKSNLKIVFWPVMCVWVVFAEVIPLVFLIVVVKPLIFIKHNYIFTPLLLAKTFYQVRSKMRWICAFGALTGYTLGYPNEFDRMIGLSGGIAISLLITFVSNIGLKFLPDPAIEFEDYKTG